MRDSTIELLQHLDDPSGADDGDGTSGRNSLSHAEDLVRTNMDHDDGMGKETIQTSPPGSARHSSGSDEAVFDEDQNDTVNSSPQTSHTSGDDISEIHSDFQGPACTPDHRRSSFYTSIKTRSPFRNPSSVRAMQMDITPPPYVGSPTSKRHRNSVSSSKNHTPRSTRSRHSEMRSPSKLSPAKKSPKKEHPLVLLHVTLLPVVLPYSQPVLESVLPPSILENWKVLREKITDTVLDRGILIPHPREDYDLLEERFLESLELKIPRILKCGHFHLDAEQEAEILDQDHEAEMDYDSDADDADICADCGQRVRDGRYGNTGSGQRRWDIKIFAANGLMRAGAWSAAWMEMERVDIEIMPAIGDALRKELDLRRKDEEREEMLRRGVDGIYGGGVDDARPGAADEGKFNDERLREIYGEDAQTWYDGLYDGPPMSDSPRTKQHQKDTQPSHAKDPIPLPTLFKAWINHHVQDKRNIFILLLSIIILFLALSPSASSPHPIIPEPSLATPATESPKAQVQVQPVVEPSKGSAENIPGVVESLTSAAADSAATIVQAFIQDEDAAMD
ncbi:hypothetical protein MMC09_005918 [Bachmanniomyces sp. S44760]|nr:hypothetical protein [Bachmanniomyces sp. S44760]